MFATDCLQYQSRDPVRQPWCMMVHLCHVPSLARFPLRRGNPMKGSLATARRRNVASVEAKKGSKCGLAKTFQDRTPSAHSRFPT